MAIESSVSEAFKIFNTNLFGILLLDSVFADMVIKAKGKIVLSGSVSGYTPHPSQAVYNSSKAGLELYATVGGHKSKRSLKIIIPSP